MALNIKDDDMLQKITHLSRVRKMTKMDVIRAALDSEIAKESNKLSVMEKLAPVLAKAAQMGNASRMTVEEHKKASDEDWGEE